MGIIMPTSILRDRRIMLLSAGSAAAPSAIRVLEAAGAEVFAGDSTLHAEGLYLIPEENRFQHGPLDGVEAIPELIRECRRLKIDLLIPTETEGLLNLATARRLFGSYGIRVLVPDVERAALCLDRYEFAKEIEGKLPTPRLFFAESLSEVMAFPFPLEIEGREPESQIRLQRIDSSHAPFLKAYWSEIVGRRLLPGPETHLLVYRSKGRERIDTLAIEAIGKFGRGDAIFSYRIVHDPEVEQLGASLAALLDLDGLYSIRIVRNARGEAEIVSADPYAHPACRLAAMAGRNLLVAAAAEALGIEYNLPDERPLALTSIQIIDELVMPSDGEERAMREEREAGAIERAAF